MRSFIKIYGPPMLQALKALQKAAVDMPEVKIMDTLIAGGMPDFREVGYTSEYFSSLPASITMERSANIISESGELLGEYNFFFEWIKGPSMDQINDLIGKIDEVLAPLGCRYTITTK